MDELPGMVPDWPAPPGVRAYQTLRAAGPDPQHADLRGRLRLPAEPSWLDQVHGRTVAFPQPGVRGWRADAAVTRTRGVVLAVRSADCLPVLLCDGNAGVIAAVHAGWRGLAAGVLESALDAMDTAPGALLAWLGPAIGPDAFEVGPEVRDVFIEHDTDATAAFTPGAGDRWHADLCMLARQRLHACGVRALYGGRWCTASDPGRFFSYRREGTAGRMVTLAWLE